MQTAARSNGCLTSDQASDRPVKIVDGGHQIGLDRQNGQRPWSTY